ncbi:hypothetical protein ABPG75_009639 [Micractinium tetrahymenae]
MCFKLAIAAVLLAGLLSSRTVAAGCFSEDEYEALSDRLADGSLALAECRKEAAAHAAELADLKAVMRSLQRSCENAGGPAEAELDTAQRELASAEEQLQAARQHLQEDAADLEADSRDLVVLRRQLFATRAALLEARQRLEEQQARLAEPGAGRVCPACPPAAEAGDAGAGGCAAALLDLQECRDEVGRLQDRCSAGGSSGGSGGAGQADDSAACASEQEMLAETRLRIAELAAERAELAARLEKAQAQRGTCPSPSDAAAAGPPGSHVANVPNTTPRHSRRTEILQNQLLADALAEVASLEEANDQLRQQVANLAWEGNIVADLQGAVAAAQNRSAELSEELARTSGSLQLARQQVETLQEERDELKSSLASNQEVAGDYVRASGSLQVVREQLEEVLKARKEDRASLVASQEALAGCQNRSAGLSEELARTSGSLSLAREQLEVLQKERDELKSSFASSQAVATSCQARSGALMEAQKRVESALHDAKKQVSEAHEAADRRVAAAERAAERRLEADRQEVAQKVKAAEAALQAADGERQALLAEKRAAEAAGAAAERARAEAEVAAAAAQAELRTVREASQAEIGRLLQVLKAHEDAAREMQRAHELLRQAESGWLPLWAQRRWAASSQGAAAAIAAAQQRTAAAWAGASGKAVAAAGFCWGRLRAAAAQQLQPAVALAQRASAAAEQLWSDRVRPLLLKAAPNWAQLEAAAQGRLHAAAQRAHAAADRLRAQAAAAKAAADAAVLRQLRAAPPALRLGALATPERASTIVWGLLSGVTLPFALALALSALRYAAYRVRPASVRVAPPASAAAWARLEQALGYSFERNAALAAALDGETAGAGAGDSARLAWLGAALLRLLAAEAAFKHAPEGASPAALEAAADALAGCSALGARAAAATLPRLVLAGPGAKSARLAADTSARLYAACVGAAYVDAGFSLDAPRAVFATTSGGGTNGSLPVDEAE